MLLDLSCRKAGGHSASFPPGNWGLLGHVNRECVDRQGNHMSIMPAQPPARILGDQDDMWGQCEPPKLSQYHLDAIKKSSPGVLQKEARSVPRTNSHEGKSGRERKAWKRRRPAPFFGEVMENPLHSMDGGNGGTPPPMFLSGQSFCGSSEREKNDAEFC